MSKKKFRDIVVDDVAYAWSVNEKRWPYAGLRIWVKSRGKVPWCELDFNVAEKVMKPSRVRELILSLLEHAVAKSYLVDKNKTFISAESEILRRE